jgi:hypothetical protein
MFASPDRKRVSTRYFFSRCGGERKSIPTEIRRKMPFATAVDGLNRAESRMNARGFALTSVDTAPSAELREMAKCFFA